MAVSFQCMTKSTTNKKKLKKLKKNKLMMKNVGVNSEMSEIALKIALRDIKGERLRITVLLFC